MYTYVNMKYMTVDCSVGIIQPLQSGFRVQSPNQDDMYDDKLDDVMGASPMVVPCNDDSCHQHQHRVIKDGL